MLSLQKGRTRLGHASQNRLEPMSHTLLDLPPSKKHSVRV